jgi:hypothetical protein
MSLTYWSRGTQGRGLGRVEGGRERVEGGWGRERGREDRDSASSTVLTVVPVLGYDRTWEWEKVSNQKMKGKNEIRKNEIRIERNKKDSERSGGREQERERIGGSLPAALLPSAVLALLFCSQRAAVIK